MAGVSVTLHSNEETGVVVAARLGKPQLSWRTTCVKTRISVAARTTTDNVNSYEEPCGASPRWNFGLGRRRSASRSEEPRDHQRRLEVDVAKSKFNPSPGPKIATLTIDASGAGLKTTYDATEADDSQVGYEYTASAFSLRSLDKSSPRTRLSFQRTGRL
jgi:hypothetical protein